MVLRRWEPFREVAGVRDTVDRFFGNRHVHPHGPREVYWGSDNLRLDVYHTPENLVLEAAIPGVKPDDVDVTVTGNILTIKGEAKSGDEAKEKSYLVREHRHGTFSRTVTLPKGLKTDEIEAAYDEGVLTLTIPKAEDAKPKAIKVSVKRAIEGKQAA